MKRNNLGFPDDFYTLGITEKAMDKAMWLGILKGIVIATLIYFIPFLLYPLIAYLIWIASYNQARFFSAQQYINNMNAQIELLYQRTDKLNNKKQEKSQIHYTHEYEKNF